MLYAYLSPNKTANKAMNHVADHSIIQLIPLPADSMDARVVVTIAPRITIAITIAAPILLFK